MARSAACPSFDPGPGRAYARWARRHRTRADLVRHPDRIWSAAPYWRAPSGLGAHVAEVAGRQAGLVWPDAWVVLSRADHQRATRVVSVDWRNSAAEALVAVWRDALRADGLRLPEGRAPRLRFAEDGVGLPRVGLGAGEFLTVLAPNVYFGPGPGSTPRAEVFVRCGGTLRAVGTWWSDQPAFHVGAHPLDDGHLPELPDSALLTLHAGATPTLHVHRAWAGRLERRPGSRDDVLGCRLRSADGAIDLEVLALEPQPAAPQPAAPTAPPPLTTLTPERAALTQADARSLMPDALPERVHSLRPTAVLLQRVHFLSEMQAYWLELDRGGAVEPVAADPVARVVVQGEQVWVEALGGDVVFDDTPLRRGERRGLSARHHVTWRGGETWVSTAARPDVPRWPYVARVERAGEPRALGDGAAWTVGRSGCDVALPDRPTTANIRWADGHGEGPVSVRGGRIDRGNFRIDAILVAARAAAIDLTGLTPRLRNLSSTCPLHVVRRDGAVERVRRDGELPLAPGDELWIGNAAFGLAWPDEAPARFELPWASTPGRAPVEDWPWLDGPGSVQGDLAGLQVSPATPTRIPEAAPAVEPQAAARAGGPVAAAALAVAPQVGSTPEAALPEILEVAVPTSSEPVFEWLRDSPSTIPTVVDPPPPRSRVPLGPASAFAPLPLTWRPRPRRG